MDGAVEVLYAEEHEVLSETNANSGKKRALEKQLLDLRFKLSNQGIPKQTPLRNPWNWTKCSAYLGKLLPTRILASNSSKASRKKVFPNQCFPVNRN